MKEEPQDPSARPIKTTLVACLIALALGAGHIAYLSFLCDDAFISFRYADNLAAGNGLVFNVGERIEGYTNYLWVLVLAGGVQMGLRPETLSISLSAFLALASLAGVLLLVHRRGANPVRFAFLVVGCSAWAAWATGGLETALFTSLVTLAFFTSTRETGPGRPAVRMAASSVLLLLATLTRPDGLLIAASFGLFHLARTVRREISVGTLVAWAAGWVLPHGLYLLWRHSYYGRWWPNTAAVKSGGLEMLPSGLLYLSDAFVRLHLYLPLAVVVLCVVRLGPRKLRSEGVALAAAIVLPYVTFVALAGGDFMDQFRLLVPVLPIFFWVVEGCLRDLSSGAGARGRLLVVGFLAGWIVLNLLGSRRSTEVWHENNVDSVGRLRKLALDWSAVGRHLRTVSAPSDSVAVTAAGCIPYYSGLYAIDQLGLTAPDLTQYADREIRRPGHRLLIRGDALVGLRPQFIVGGPIVGEQPEAARFAPWVDDSGQEVLRRDYRRVGAEAESPEGPRYYLMGVRRDVAERLR